MYAYRSPERYYTPSMMATRGIDEMYVYGGASYNAVPTPSGSFVARVDLVRSKSSGVLIS